MEELIKGLSSMSGSMQDLWIYEQDTFTKISFLKMHLMITDYLTIAMRYKNLTSESSLYKPSIQKIRETETLVKEYKEKTRDHGDILDHVMKVTNGVSRVFLELIQAKNEITPHGPSLNTGVEMADGVLNGSAGNLPPSSHAAIQPINQPIKSK